MRRNIQTVTHELGLRKLPPLTPNQKAELEMLRQSGDEGIDYSDIHGLCDQDFRIRSVRLKTVLNRRSDLRT